MYAFEFHRPRSLDAAAAALESAADGKLVAGGHSLLPMMKQRLASFSDLIDLSAVPDLDDIRAGDGELVIGAMATHASVAASHAVRSSISALADLAAGIGDPQVRNRGTLGGAIAHADPAADYPAAVVALGASVQTSRRLIDADDFFTGLFETALGEREIVTQVRFPVPERAAYVKFPNPASRYAIVGVMVARTGGAVRVAVTGAGASVFRVAEMEQALAGDFTPEAIAGISVPPDGLNGDIHAGPDYRAHLITVMARRAVAAANA